MTEPMFAVAGPVFTIDGDRVPSLARDCVRLEIEEGRRGPAHAAAARVRDRRRRHRAHRTG